MTPARIKKKHYLLSKETWTFLILSVLLLSALLHFADLSPHVDENFFFSEQDPEYQVEDEITELFTREDSQLIISAEGPIFDETYTEKIAHLTDIIAGFEGVLAVKSITSGPKDLADAIESPLWSRLLIPKNHESTNVIVLLRTEATENLVRKIEYLATAMQADSFRVRISGFPFIVEQIRRSLFFDLRVFSTLAFVFFGIIVVLIFHSWRILLAMVVTCINAYAMTFLITDFLGIQIGVLTANLATIIFVLTLSHIVFLTFNWLNGHPHDTDLHHHSIAHDAVVATLPASFWSMFTTLLGFFSLLLVKAQPLRELGTAGAFGTLCAFISVYAFYPAFLRLRKPTHRRSDIRIRHYYRELFIHAEKYRGLIVFMILLVAIITAPHLTRINLNPSLISYFAKKSVIAEGLTYIDANGGSSPLVIVVKQKDGGSLDAKKSYGRLWNLQKAFEKNPYVGSVMSLPTLLAEGKRSKMKLFATSRRVIDALEGNKYNQIANSFISEDRRYGLFFFRMIDRACDIGSLLVIEELKGIVQQHGYIPHLVGGSYFLQGRLSKHIESSLIVGLIRLIALFSVVALFVSLSLWGMVTMTISVCLIPLCIIGTISFFRIPLDIISAPASNVAIAMGIDFIIHMVYAYRRSKKKDKDCLKRWLAVRKQMWGPIITAMFIVSSGFSIFFFSSFPPTQRFGGSIVFGTILSAMIALFVFPLINRER